MEMKKISFGFSKSARKPLLQAGPSAIGVREKDERDKIELISCVEEQSIKVVGRENGDDTPKDLVIPLREQDRTTVPGRLAKLQGIKEERDPGGAIASEKKEETLEQKAAREIMEDLKERQDNLGKGDSFVVPLKPEDLPLEGARESTLDDYELIPIESFGMAMLRGMGFKEDPAKKKDKDDGKLPDGPVMRPKGLGLGAERAPKDASKQIIPPAKDEVLAMRNGAFVKVLTGRQKDAYGTVESLNEDTGRVMVKFAIGGNRDYVNEYLLQLVSKAEFDQYGKVLNKEKYEEYKNKTTNPVDQRRQEQKEESPPERVSSREDRHQPQQHPSRSSHREDRREERYRDEDRRRECSSSEDDSRHRSHHKPSRTSSGTKKKSHKYKQHRREYSRERDHGARDRDRNYRRGSSDDDETSRRDAHKQKKTKKSKRQRSRSR
uniref:Putative dexh-box splicing factor binding site n=1 Tax=Culex tarsalis TaxID=7177 RepID=A0A1Q3G114_CULTA